MQIYSIHSKADITVNNCHSNKEIIKSKAYVLFREPFFGNAPV